MSESKHIYIVYEITCLVNNKIYIGYHEQKPGFGPFEFDGYLGSGKSIKRAVKKYGKENFVRETLFVYDNPDEAFDKEAEIVNEAFVACPDTYNLVEGGSGGRDGYKTSEETKQKISAAKKGKKHTEEQNKRKSERQKGKNTLKNTKEKIAKQIKAKNSQKKQNKK